VTSRAADEIRVNLATAAVIPGIRPGIAGVQLVQPVMLGHPEAPHEGFVSNIASFVLVPTITATVVPGGISVVVAPRVGANQRVRLLLNQSDAAPGTIPRAYSFEAPAGNGVVGPAVDTDTVAIPVTGVAPGDYLVRLSVDGALSIPVISGGVYAQPEVTL
jgi:hypothetical protein